MNKIITCTPCKKIETFKRCSTNQKRTWSAPT